MGKEKGGEMNYNSTGAMWTGTWEPETETLGGNMIRVSSHSGLMMAEDDEDDDYIWQFVSKDRIAKLMYL